jgi:multiple sugar transport system permease protein
VSTVYLSFTHYDLLQPSRWVGLANYRYLFTGDKQIWPSVYNTLWLVVIMVPLKVMFAFGVALMLTRARRGVGFFRTVFYLPALAPPVAATLGFVYLLNPATGPVNGALRLVGIDGPLWFSSPTWSKPALTLLALWGVGDLMVIFMASLLDVPKDQYEAAELDHAGPWQRFRFITMPNISPIVLFAVVTGVIQTMQYYTQPLVASKVASGVIGRPGQSFEPGYPEKSTLTLPHLVYNLGFQRFDTGSACVVALVLFALAMAFTAVLMRRGSGFLSAEDR